jgi:endonuclease-3
VEKKLEDFDTLEKLVELHWVWIKTAKVFLAVFKDGSYLAVDTHVHRVLNRVWIVKAKTPLETNKKAEEIFTTDDLGKLHHSLIMFWRYHCTARKPKCEICELSKVCDYYKRNFK